MNDLLQNHRSGTSGPVECLGQTFASDDARRDHFLKLLAEKLQDPAFREREGFPTGSDAAILAMSDPPYYTACPNPWLAEFVAHYGKPYDPAVKYSREPLAIDVSVGKTDAIYRAHSYHTKVPHLAIVPSILHYTQPGDVVLDGFSGSGMTGVAAQWCGTAPSSYRHELELTWKKEGRAAPKWGARRAVLNDLSPAATFIGANYNIPFDVDAFAKAGKQLLQDVERDIGWMYETLHSDGKTKGRIEYTVWSEEFSCPECAGVVNFVDEALEGETKRVRDVFPCPHCGAELNKDRLERVLETRVDPATGEPWQRVKFRPSIIAYTVGKARYEKEPDAADLAALAKIEALPLPASVPTSRFPIEDMYHGSRIAPKGFTHVHHFYLSRAAQAMGGLWAKAQAHPDARIRAFLTFMVEQAIWGLSVLNRYSPTHFSQVNRMLNGVYYVASQHAECSPWYNLGGKLDRLVKAFGNFKVGTSWAAINTGTAARLPLPDGSIDYIFTDPPFGENIYYADPALKVLVFTEFVPTQAMLADYLESRGFTVAMLNGGMDMEARTRTLQTFAQDARVLISTDAGGEGLNLQFCHVIVNFDMPWNPMRIEQRIGRVDRIGQKHVVRALNFVLEDTVEHRVRQVLEEKLAVIAEEFGVDKAADVMDSAEVEPVFDELFVQSLQHPEAIERECDSVVSQLRATLAESNRNSDLLAVPHDLDAE